MEEKVENSGRDADGVAYSPSEGVVVHGLSAAARSEGRNECCEPETAAERSAGPLTASPAVSPAPDGEARNAPAPLIWCETYTGVAVNLIEPDPGTIRRDDIVHHLCHINRFSGATISPYSVAQHSIWVSHAVERLGGRTEAQLWGLLHDAHEAYIGDLTRPVQQALGHLAGFPFRHSLDQITSRLDQAIQAWAGITLEWADLQRVREADSLALRYEASHLMSTGGKNWSLPPNLTCLPLNDRPVVLKVEEVRRRFIERIVELTRGRSLK